MTHVNSTLTNHEFVLWGEWMKTLGEWNGLIYSFPYLGVTVAIMPEFPGSRMMLVSVSIAESRETKFKPKVGEYHALRRMFEENQYLKLPSVFDPEFGDTYPDTWAGNFARAI